jgi:hypothetical protein
MEIYKLSGTQFIHLIHKLWKVLQQRVKKTSHCYRKYNKNEKENLFEKNY